MVVKFTALPVTSGFLCYAVLNAMLVRYPVSKSYRTVSITVPDWPSWLRCMWHAYAMMSRESCPDVMRRVYLFRVKVDSGAEYKVAVSFDVVCGGLRYGSVE